VHLDAALGQRQRDAARADRELERRPCARQFGQRFDGLVGLEKAASPYQASYTSAMRSP
jgi:hypothetical protein